MGQKTILVLAIFFVPYLTSNKFGSVKVQCISPSLQSPTGCVPACVYAAYLMNLRDFFVHRLDIDTNTSQVGRIASSIATALTVDARLVASNWSNSARSPRLKKKRS